MPVAAEMILSSISTFSLETSSISSMALINFSPGSLKFFEEMMSMNDKKACVQAMISCAHSSTVCEASSLPSISSIAEMMPSKMTSHSLPERLER